MEGDGQNEKPSVLYKIVVCGDPTVGKTSIINRFVHKFFSREYKCTIGVDFALKEIEKDDKKIRLQLWDIAGQERYNTLTHIYYRNAVGVIIVFDVTQKDTFQNVKLWKKDIDNKVFINEESDELEPVPCILLANKVDMSDSFDSSQFEELDEYCKEKKFRKWFKSSAKTGEGLDNAVDYLIVEIEKALEKIEKDEDPDVFSLEKGNKQSKRNNKKGGETGNNCPC